MPLLLASRILLLLSAKAIALLMLLTFAVAYRLADPHAGYVRSKQPQQPPSQYAASADQPTLSMVDPRTGKPIWTALASSSTAQTGSTSGSVLGTLHNVRGTFYQDGVAADHMTAPTVTAQQTAGVVVVTATGGVTVQSISQPDSSLRCDTAVWRSDTDKILGTGHVILKKGAFTQRGGSILGDAKLKSAVMPAPAAGVLGSAGIHAHFQAARRHMR